MGPPCRPWAGNDSSPSFFAPVFIGSFARGLEVPAQAGLLGGRTAILLEELRLVRWMREELVRQGANGPPAEHGMRCDWLERNG